MPLSKPLKSFWKNSQTKAWGYAQLAGTGLLGSISAINSAISDPSVKSYLDQIDLPKTLIAGIAVMGLLTLLFHGHGDD